MTESESYVGIKPCGCAVTAVVDRPEWAKDTAKDIAGWVRAGLRVERWTTARVRAELAACIHVTPSPEQPELFADASAASPERSTRRQRRRIDRIDL